MVTQKNSRKAAKSATTAKTYKQIFFAILAFFAPLRDRFAPLHDLIAQRTQLLRG